MTSIGSYVFSNCTELHSVTIGIGLTAISIYTFVNCSKLTSVSIGDNVTSIGINAFRQCTALQSVTIGNSVTTISSQSFQSCDNLTKAYMSPATASTLNKSFGTGQSFYGTSGVTISQPEIIYVDSGSFTSPYYNFYTDSSGTNVLEDTKLDLLSMQRSLIT